MPLFGVEYEVRKNPDAMSFEVESVDGTKLVIQPHLCSSHEDQGHNQRYDHRGYLDCIMFIPNAFGIPIPSGWTINLPLASAMVEGFLEVAPYAQINSELEG